MGNKLEKLYVGAVLSSATLLCLAGVASADAVEDQVSNVSDQFTGYAGGLAIAIGAVVAVFVALPLIKRFAKMVRNAVG